MARCHPIDEAAASNRPADFKDAKDDEKCADISTCQHEREDPKPVQRDVNLEVLLGDCGV